MADLRRCYSTFSEIRSRLALPDLGFRDREALDIRGAGRKVQASIFGRQIDEAGPRETALPLDADRRRASYRQRV